MVALLSPQFVKELWGKQATELAISQIPFNDKDVLDALREYAVCANDIRSRNSQSEAITAFNGKRTPEPHPDFLVRPTDNTLEDYVSRIERLAGDDEWTVMYYGLHAASPVIWDVAKAFSDQLALSIGYRPGGRVDIDCFIGRYSSTYIGIHVDHAHNFGFTLRDGKTMFTWPGTRSDLVGVRFPDYESFKPEGIPLENKTNRVTYFPEDWLHVAETKSDVSVNVNIAFWETGNDSQQNANYVKGLLQAPNRTRHDVRSSGIASLNPDDALLLSSLKALLDSASLKRRMMISQLISDTSSRLNVGRPIVEVEELDDVIALNAVSTLQWMPVLQEGEVLVAANGHCGSFRYSRALHDFLNSLSAGQQVNISDLSSGKDRLLNDDFLSVAASLARWGAL
ncbi:hypothetical protein [Burkholderia oklahomensis]|uniref:JmjC domain-containing protein n=1 Tax=Burkholderia oklahomensis TaxID=342113 RepID=A0AAI8FLQ1_9BURK|nr:hypothetical protein [Burkholderia oklahomensis]AIO65015.1 hypothetical protein DM82_328 [Burkholderia oklahomensis]AJX32530.1 hypothetical protein BG90_698 [Burkholderia oklahomensis C6786]AOI43274.1 hypothetical protein WG70_27650 [Burkholderia oklahomensis EO147]AOI46845.1 hypothetical protein WI23_14260 [Burkholderia oklahomensis C6786]KUY58499.1 hypothetical protein WI23_18075 [Burkholderia oklahomensis C6786]